MLYIYTMLGQNCVKLFFQAYYFSGGGGGWRGGGREDYIGGSRIRRWWGEGEEGT